MSVQVKKICRSKKKNGEGCNEGAMPFTDFCRHHYPYKEFLWPGIFGLVLGLLPSCYFSWESEQLSLHIENLKTPRQIPYVGSAEKKEIGVYSRGGIG